MEDGREGRSGTREEDKQAEALPSFRVNCVFFNPIHPESVPPDGLDTLISVSTPCKTSHKSCDSAPPPLPRHMYYHLIAAA